MKSFPGFISFEGIDFSGKSTQIKLLLQHLAAIGLNAEVFREPGGTKISEQIRHLLLSPENNEMSNRAELLLYSAARAQLVEEVLVPVLKNGAHLIADRFFDSTTAYQGFGRQLDMAFIRQLNDFATDGLKPYRTILIDVKPETAMHRRKLAGRSNDRLEAENLRFYQRIREGYHQIADAEKQRFMVIDGERSPQTIAAEIHTLVKTFWPV